MTPPSAGCRSARAPPTSKCFRESAGDRAGAQDPAGPRPGRRRRGRAAERRGGRLARGEGHADVRAVGVLRRRDALRLLPAATEGARPRDPAQPRGSGPRAQDSRRRAPPALRRPRMGRVPGGFAGGGAPGAPLAPPGLRGGQDPAGAGLTAPAGSARGSSSSIFTSGTRSQAAAVKAALITTSHWYPTLVWSHPPTIADPFIPRLKMDIS